MGQEEDSSSGDGGTGSEASVRTVLTPISLVPDSDVASILQETSSYDSEDMSSSGGGGEGGGDGDRHRRLFEASADARELVINVDVVSLACCMLGTMIGQFLRCGAEGGCRPAAAHLCLCAALLDLLVDCSSDAGLLAELDDRLEQAVTAMVTATSAHDAELQPVRDISDLALPSYPYQAGPGMEPTCSVCYEDFEPNEAVCHLYCGHTFHPACIYKWALYKDDCPMCRTALESRRANSGRSPRNQPPAENLPPRATMA